MIFSLAFLTCVNYFLYADHGNQQITATSCEAGDTSENIPPNPTEEKSGNTGFSIMEEMMHEHQFSLDLSWFNKLYLHKVAEAGKIEMVHYDLLSPPPEA
jgi:hypothetical protein